MLEHTYEYLTSHLKKITLLALKKKLKQNLLNAVEQAHK